MLRGLPHVDEDGDSFNLLWLVELAPMGQSSSKCQKTCPGRRYEVFESKN
jgi:hypothetical protein